MKSLTLELGARRIWNGHTPGKWVAKERRLGQDGRMLTDYDHEPAVHQVEVTDDIAEGLVASSEAWKDANKRQVDPDGTLNRMIRVSNIKKIGPDPPRGLPPMARMIEQLGQSIADSILAAVNQKKG